MLASLILSLFEAAHNKRRRNTRSHPAGSSSSEEEEVKEVLKRPSSQLAADCEEHSASELSSGAESDNEAVTEKPSCPVPLVGEEPDPPDGEGYDDEEAAEADLANESDVGSTGGKVATAHKPSYLISGVYSLEYSRTMLKLSRMQYEEKIFKNISSEVFPDMKFPDGGEAIEHDIIELAMSSGDVTVSDKKITKEAFVEEFFVEVPKALTRLRQRAVNSARSKFKSEFKIFFVWLNIHFSHVLFFFD